MYTQALNTQDTAPAAKSDPQADARFQARVDAEEKIEPNDAMPEAYRRTLTRQIAQHAHSEIVGMLPEGNWITRAPSLKRKAALLAKVQDEGGHGPISTPPRDARHFARTDGRAAALRRRQIFVDLQLPDIDLGRYRIIGWLVDGAAIMNQIPLCRCSYGPYARAMVRICKEESFHQRQATRS